jgi:predicted phosphodiesterase
MTKTRTVRRIFSQSLLVLFSLSLLSVAYIIAVIIYGKSHKDIQLPKFLGSRPENIALLKQTDAGPKPFSFFVVGDMQQGDFFSAIYRDSIGKDAPDFGVILGDFIRSPEMEFHKAFMTDFTTWGIQEPVFLVCGNHDIATKKDITQNRPYSFTLEDFEKTYGPTEFSFTYHGCLFIVLNDVDTDGYIAYLVDTLSHRAKDTLMTFVFTHIPVHTISPDIKSREMPGEERFLSLIDEYNIDYVISGDFHTYFRRETNNTTFIISGGGMNRMGDNERNRKGAYHAMLIHVDPLTKDVTERVYCQESRTRIGYAIRKALFAEVLVFFEHHKRWEALILSLTVLLSITLGVWRFVYATDGRAKERKKR